MKSTPLYISCENSESFEMLANPRISMAVLIYKLYTKRQFRYYELSYYFVDFFSVRLSYRALCFFKVHKLHKLRIADERCLGYG